MGKLSTAEVLRLRATSAVPHDQSVRRFAQDDDSVGVSTKNPKQVSAYGTKHRPSAALGMTNLRLAVNLGSGGGGWTDPAQQQPELLMYCFPAECRLFSQPA
jgi:hypothetical protein